MWDWCSCCFNGPQQNPLLTPQQQEDENDDVFFFSGRPFSAFKMKFTSWLADSPGRYILLIVCFPFLLPLLCATCPLLCTLEIFYLLFCRGGRRRRQRRKEAEDSGGDGLRRCEEGGEEMGFLLRRYLEDQLGLVIGSVYEFRGEDDEVDFEYFDCKSPLLQIQEI